MKTKVIASFLLIISLALVGAAVLKHFFPTVIPSGLIERYNKQQNPFSIPKDSSEIVWARASKFMEMRKLMIVGGELQKNDSVIYMPYYNDFHKGHSLRIDRKSIGDSTVFTIKLWYSGKLKDMGSKEIALYMKTGIDRRDLK
jgi:hypothetical protein